MGRSWAMFWCHFFGLACEMGSKRALGVDFGLLGEGFGRVLGGVWEGFGDVLLDFLRGFSLLLFAFCCALVLCSFALVFALLCASLAFFCLSLFAFWPSISESISSAFRSWLATTSSGKRFSVFGGSTVSRMQEAGWMLGPATQVKFL